MAAEVTPLPPSGVGEGGGEAEGEARRECTGASVLTKAAALVNSAQRSRKGEGSVRRERYSRVVPTWLMRAAGLVTTVKGQALRAPHSSFLAAVTAATSAWLVGSARYLQQASSVR